MKKKDKKVLIIIGIIALFLFLGKTGFLESVVTTCYNNEPNSVNEFRDSISEINGSFYNAGVFSLIQEDSEILFSQFTAVSSLGTFNIINTSDWECDDLLYVMNQQDNTTSYVVLNQKQVLLNSDELKWCNNNNNFLISADSVSELSAYDDHYIECTSVFIDDFEVEKAACEATDGVWTGTNTCECPEDYDYDGENGCIYVGSGSSSTTTSTTTDSSKTTTSTQQESKYDRRFFLSVIAVLGIVFALYWMFEKGPNKGFIRKRRRKK